MPDRAIKQRVQDRYDETSPGKAKKYRNPYWRFYYQNSFGQFISQQVRAIEDELDRDRVRILDLGTGAGLYSYLLQGENREILGVDISTAAVSTAYQELGDVASFMLGDGEQLGIESEAIDIIVSMGTFEYIDDLDTILSELSRVLAPAGYLLFSAHNSDSLQDRRSNPNGTPVAEHSQRDLASALGRHGFELQHATTVFSVPSLVKKGFMSERVPDIIRWVVLLLSVLAEHTAEGLPYLRRRGDFWLVVAKKPAEPQNSEST